MKFEANLHENKLAYVWVADAASVKKKHDAFLASGAVSQTWALTTLSWTRMERVANSTLMVGFDYWLNSFRLKRDTDAGTADEHQLEQKIVILIVAECSHPQQQLWFSTTALIL